MWRRYFCILDIDLQIICKPYFLVFKVSSLLVSDDCWRRNKNKTWLFTITTLLYTRPFCMFVLYVLMQSKSFYVRLKISQSILTSKINNCKPLRIWNKIISVFCPFFMDKDRNITIYNKFVKLRKTLYNIFEYNSLLGWERKY